LDTSPKNTLFQGRLIIPFYALYYTLTRIEQMWMPLAVQLAGLGLVYVALSILAAQTQYEFL
ncbi:MAG: hypothetical protein ACKVH8_18725, partial [Pirellulales bacterium]